VFVFVGDGKGTTWSLGTFKGIVEIGKLGNYVTMPIILTFANNPRNLNKFIRNVFS